MVTPPYHNLWGIADVYKRQVQKTDNDDHQKRMRYNLANIDTTFAEKGIKYADLPDIYAIFISPFDLFRANCTAYHVNRCLLETGDIVNNGIHELYVNAAVNDGSDTVSYTHLDVYKRQNKPNAAKSFTE